MSSPKEGAFYSVVKGDTIRNISRAVYGRDVSSLIIESNDTLLRSREKSYEGIPFIYPGDSLWIPPYKNRYNNEPTTADFDTQVSIKMNGVDLPGAMASRISRAMNTISSGFVFDVPFDSNDKAMVELLRPYSWNRTELRVGGELYLTALASKWSYQKAGDSSIATIECRTMPGEMMECMGMRSRLSYSGGISLIDLCQDVARPYGITCYTASGSGGTATKATTVVIKKATTTPIPGTQYSATTKELTEAKFAAVEQDETETDAAFLERVVATKGFLIHSLPDGNLIICRANTEDKPSVALIEGRAPVKSVASDFDGSKRFSTWKGYTEETGTASIPTVLKDVTVPRARTFCFKADDTEEANLPVAVKWRMAKSLNESLSIPVDVEGWRNAEGEMWAENMKVTLHAPSVFILRETEFIIESVELTKDIDGGDQASLSLVLPGSFTTTMPKQPFPWEGYAEVKE